MVTLRPQTSDFKPQTSYDVIIVGGSVAGAATAFWLGQAGFRVLVLDRAVFPRDKVCGEGIMPVGVEILSDMGISASLRAQGAWPFYGITFYDHHGCSASGIFPDATERPGLIIRRLHLDALLLQKAATVPGVEIRQGFYVTRVLEQQGRVCGVAGRLIKADKASEEFFTALLTVGADGLQSIFHRLGRIRVRRPRPQRFGVRAHLKGVEGLGSRVEVMTSPIGELYIAAHSQDMAMVALLLRRQAMKNLGGDLEAGYWEILHSIRPFGERIERSKLISPVMASGPLGSRVHPCVGDGFLLIGDSGGALDPIAGEGMALSLRSAKVAVQVATEAFCSCDFSADRLSAYSAAREAMFRPLARLTDLLLFLSRHERLAHWSITSLHSHPTVMNKLLAVASGLYSSH
ncbi:MAG: FAD-dependent monooxygenase [Acidobacteria bacterium]|nr:FAD-dependent monooxygenase [Acidobacteriota bacterium]